MPAVEPSLTETLQRARKARRLSQMELALRLGVSQRHVSFVERGRSRPSRALLLAWLQALEAPLPMSNEALLLAGYAPAYTSGRLDDPSFAEASRALGQLLDAHEPAPAFVLDADWNLLRLNSGAAWLAATLLPWLGDEIGKSPINLLDVMVHPQGIGRHVSNIADVGPLFLDILRRDAAARPSLRPRVAAYESFLASRVGTLADAASTRPRAPVLTTRLASPHGELSFFSMFTTFGTPQDITLASLRVEHMFPADEATRATLQRNAR